MMYDHRLWQSMNKPGKVANPARGQLNKKKVFPPVSVVFAKRQTPRLHISVLLHCYTIKRQYLTWNRKSQSMMNPPAGAHNEPSLVGAQRNCRQEPQLGVRPKRPRLLTMGNDGNTSVNGKHGNETLSINLIHSFHVNLSSKSIMTD